MKPLVIMTHFNFSFTFICQHDAACRVIARLKKERDEARMLLAQAERQIPSSMASAANANNIVSNGKRGFCYLLLLLLNFSSPAGIGSTSQEFAYLQLQRRSWALMGKEFVQV